MSDGAARPPLAETLPLAFYERDALELAPALLGHLVVRRVRGRLLAGRIVETEAYRPDDPASHSFGGPRVRNRSMFGPPGRAYVYVSYGIHHCMNVVGTGASAVLLRALEPVRGLDAMAGRRGTPDPRLLCAGPGRLCQALEIDRSLDGWDLTMGKRLWLAPGKPAGDVVTTPRIGISAAVEAPWRFVERGSRFVSRRLRNGRDSPGG